MYQESESGPSVMAFICSEGVIVAVDCSVSGGACELFYVGIR